MLARIKVGDLVQVLSGKDKAKRGEVIAITKDRTKVKVRGVALVTKFDKNSKKSIPARTESATKGMFRTEAFIHSCKVMPICPKTDRPCRVKTLTIDNSKVRVSVRSGLKI